MGASFRARRPRASPWWQCLHSCLPDFFGNYSTHYEQTQGPLRPVVSVSLRAFQRCGDLAQGFTRIRCASCEHEYLLPFTCKKRGACPSCHQRRSVEAAEIISGEICVAVPHRHIVLTVPRALRWPFRRNREHLSLLYAAARETLVLWLRERAGQSSGEIAAVATLHTFGDYLVFHPHLHILAASGVFDDSGGFHLAKPGGTAELAELFRHAVLRRFVDAGIIQAWQAHRFLAWRDSGFHVDTGEAPLAAADTAGRQRLAEYLLRAPLSLEKMHWNAAARTVLYRSARSWRTKRNYEIFSGADFIAAVAEHIPAKHAQMIRYYGRYSNKRRAMLSRNPGGTASVPSAAFPHVERTTRRSSLQKFAERPSPHIEFAQTMPRIPRRRRTLWRALIIRVWGADPLRCPCCGGLMRKIAVVKKPETIRAVLTRLGLWEGATAIPPAHAPPLPGKTILWGVDVWDGRLVEFEPGWVMDGLPTQHRSQAPRERHVAYTLEDCETPDVKVGRGVPDPPGFANQDPNWQPPTQQRDDGLLLVFDPAAAGPPDDEPVFWTD